MSYTYIYICRVTSLSTSVTGAHGSETDRKVSLTDMISIELSFINSRVSAGVSCLLFIDTVEQVFE